MTAKEIGKMIYDKRKEQDLTQEALSLMSGVSINTIYRLEHYHPVSMTVLDLLCNQLGLSVEVVVRDDR